MKRIYLEAFCGLVILFFATLWGYETVVYQWNTDYDQILEQYQAEAFHQLLEPAFAEKGDLYVTQQIRQYAASTRTVLTLFDPMALPAEVDNAFANSALQVYFDQDRSLWLRFDDTSMVYHLTEDIHSPLRQAIDFADNLIWVFFMLGFAIYCVLLIWFLSRRVRELERVTLAFASGDLSVRAKTTSSYSVGSLNKSFNIMADKIANLITSNRMLTNAVAHELRTPIFRLQWQADLLADSELSQTQRKSVSSMVEDIDEMEHMVEEMLYYAKMERPQANIQTQSIILSSWFTTLQQRWQSETSHSVDIELQTPLSSVHIDPHLVKRALDNLVRNAMRYAKSRIVLTIFTDEDQLTVEVHDDGLGISEKDWPYLFDAFYSVDKSRNKSTSGYGLGLAIVKQIATVHRGGVDIAHSPLGGACFSLHVRHNAVTQNKLH
ncbi:HAMP domain-containing protein [Vibrio navarrensis]|uniref:histidine kinase n=1 Tax=Vibrio navarrensis TaxID=29495 RepID=A0AAI9CXD3_9VIBR|nr:ATP-binding protein [Vibrio navarrensis]ELN6934152.1 HAMP domain-containing protein [Vibrio navarrensis]MBE4618319.1 two-component sensor histidine kinase [Vibrio navarrensis]